MRDASYATGSDKIPAMIRFLLKLGLPDTVYLLLFGFLPSDFSPSASESCKRAPVPSKGEIEESLHKWLEGCKYRCGNATLSDLAFDTKIPERHLRHYFKEDLNTNFRNWKMTARLEKAMKIMEQDPDKTVSSVAKQLGFEDKTNFHRQFRRATGCTPKQWKTTNCF